MISKLHSTGLAAAVVGLLLASFSALWGGVEGAPRRPKNVVAGGTGGHQNGLFNTHEVDLMLAKQIEKKILQEVMENKLKIIFC